MLVVKKRVVTTKTTVLKGAERTGLWFASSDELQKDRKTVHPYDKSRIEARRPGLMEEKQGKMDQGLNQS